MYPSTDFGNGDSQRTDVIPNESGFGTLSDSSIAVEYQREELNSGFYPTSAGNFAFFTEEVLFMGINQVGGGRVGDEATRVHANYRWVRENLARHVSRGMRAMVIFAHASMTSSRRQYFGDPFMRLMRDQYPGIKALYVHGDGHDFELYRPDNSNPNLYALEVDGGDEADPLLISVVHDTVEDEFSFNIDARGGYYHSGCDAGNAEKTWSSNY